MRPDLVFTQPLFIDSFIARGADVAAAWLLTYLVHSTVILLIAWVVTSRASVTDTVRDVVWKFALVGGLVTASVQTMVAREPLGGQLKIASRTAVDATPFRVALRPAPDRQMRRFVISQPRGTRWSAALVVLWLTSAGGGLLWLTFRHGRTMRILGDRAPLDGTPVRASLDDLLARSGVSMPIALSSSSAIASPIALAGNEVCLPRRALLELAPNELEAMLAHEVAHLVRRDPQWLIVARVVETVLFLQPLNRLARYRLQEVAEFLCDDWAVSRMSQPVTLAKCLAAVAEWVGKAPKVRTPRLQPMSAMAESVGSPLVRRVGRILDGRHTRRARRPRFTFALSASALVGLIALAPRISVGHATPPGGMMTFVRTTANGAAGPVPAGMLSRDSIVVVRARAGARVLFDSLVRHRRATPAGELMGRANVIVLDRVRAQPR
jgi:beta-lactamase regulating signal transducer with metallopeptidase domain